MSNKIMIIEPDLSVARALSTEIRNNGFDVKTFMDGETALHELHTYKPDLCIVSLELPDADSLSVCREICLAFSIPLMVISSNANIETKILLLGLGADDYMVKPCDSREVAARIHVILRRTGKDTSLISDALIRQGEYVEYPDLYINLTSYLVIYDGETLSLPPKELELLYCLAASPNRVFSREQLLDHVWGYDYLGDPRTVDVHIKRLREKIKDHETWSLSTVWGVGYKFSVT